MSPEELKIRNETLDALLYDLPDDEDEYCTSCGHKQSEHNTENESADACDIKGCDCFEFIGQKEAIQIRVAHVRKVLNHDKQVVWTEKEKEEAMHDCAHEDIEKRLRKLEKITEPDR